MHGFRVDGQDDVRSPPGANTMGGLDVYGQVHGMPLAGQQTLTHDRVEVSLRRAVKQSVRWDRGAQAQVYRDRMTLVGAYPSARLIQRKALLVIGPHNPCQLLGCYRLTAASKSREQYVNIDPARSVKRDPDATGIVPQHQRQEPRGANIVHPDSVSPTTHRCG
jgi:hypothetical protein